MLRAALGSLDRLGFGDTALAAGWLLHPDHPIDRVTVAIDGVPLGAAAVGPRPDVAAAFPAVPHAAASGFAVSGALPEPAGALATVEAVGHAAGHPLLRAEFPWPVAPPSVPLPEVALRVRVSATADPAQFDRAGIAIAAELLAAVRRHLPPGPAPRLLDWGCGAGRATRFMPWLWPGLRLAGCDIDAAAISWCRAHLSDGAFHLTGPFPPLPFPDAAFDAVVAASVMTHLAWPVQLRWLREIRRVLAPGGVFVASVHGRLAALPLPGAEQAALARAGLLDGTRDARLDGIAPAAYYRATYQTEAFTRRRWAAALAFREYREAGIGNHQDLIVLRRRGGVARWLGR